MVKIRERIAAQKGVAGVYRYVKKYEKSFILISALGVISAIANGFVPYVTGRFFDALIALSAGRTTTTGIAPWLLFLAAWALIQAVANGNDWIMDRATRRIDTLIQVGIQADGFKQLLKLPLNYHVDTHINGVLSRISNASWRIRSVIQNVVQLTPQFLSVLIGITLSASINPLLASILGIGVLIYVALMVNIVRPMAKADDEAHTFWNDSWSDAAEAIHQIQAVKQSAAEFYEIQKIEDIFMGKVIDLWYRLEKTWSNIGFFQRLIVFLTQLTVFIVSVHLIQQGTITVGQLVALNGYALMFFGPFVQLGYSWQVIQNGLTSAAHLEEVLTSVEEPYHPTDAQLPESRTGSVVYDHVSFAYSTKDTVVLRDIHFTAEPGTTVALVGESGAGKSTIISLLSGYYVPTGGTVYVDGIDTRRWDLGELRSGIAVVPQEVTLFNNSLRMNIKYGSFTVTDEQMEAAIEQVHLTSFIANLPEGYDTQVGERGIKLSVGQKQRIAIARAILRNPEILILDEPTSALDSQTERYITESLERLMVGRTTFIIAHRLSTVRDADKILVIKDGTIAEQGTHEELLTISDGIYSKLYKLHIGLHE